MIQTRTGRFLFTLCSFVCGVIFASFVSLPWMVLLLVSGVCFLLLWVRKTPKWRVVFVSLFLFFCGMGRFVLATPSEVSFPKEPVSVVGMVSDFPQSQGALRKMRFKIWQVQENPSSQTILLYQSVSTKSLAYGDVLAMTCTLQEPPVLPEFDYKSFLKNQGIVALCYYPQIQQIWSDQGDPIQKALFSFRSILQSRITYWLPGQAGEVSNSLLFGSSYLLDEKTKLNIQWVGLSHIFAISGQNILFFAVIFHWIVFCLGFSKKMRCFLVCLLIWLFIALIGFPESAVRAGIMGVFVYLAIALGRPYFMLSSIMASAFLFVWYDPFVLFRIGFQLSYLAVCGIYFFYESAEGWLTKLQIPDIFSLRANLAMSLSVTPFIWPISVFVFHQFSWVSFITNLLVLPMIGYVMVLLLLLCLFSWIPVLAAPISWVISVIVTYMLSVCAYFSSFSFFIWQKLSLSWFALIFWYIITIGFGVFLKYVQKNR